MENHGGDDWWPAPRLSSPQERAPAGADREAASRTRAIGLRGPSVRPARPPALPRPGSAQVPRLQSPASWGSRESPTPAPRYGCRVALRGSRQPKGGILTAQARASATARRGARRQQLQVTVSGGAPPPRPPGPLLPLRLRSWKLREPRARAPPPKPVAERGKSAFGKTRSSDRHACGPGGISRTGHSPRSQTTNFPSLRAKVDTIASLLVLVTLNMLWERTSRFWVSSPAFSTSKEGIVNSLECYKS